MFMYLLETANIMSGVLGLSCYVLNMVTPYHIFCPYLESLACFHGEDLIVQSLYEHLKDRKAGWN